jgi:hypothetical protein
VPAPIARELVTQFHFRLGDAPSPDPYADAPASPKAAPLGIIKTGVDLAPIEGRPRYRFIAHPNVRLDQPVALNEATIAPLLRVEPQGGHAMSAEAYDKLTPEQAEMINSMDRAMSAGALLDTTISTLTALAAAAERSVLLSDATLRRRMLLESGAIGAAAPEGTRLQLYYQLVITGEGQLEEHNTYIGCVAQLQRARPGAAFEIVDGEGYGYHAIQWQKNEGSLPPPPPGYIPAKEAKLNIPLVDPNETRRFDNAFWELAYRSCRVAVTRLAARRSHTVR